MTSSAAAHSLAAEGAGGSLLAWAARRDLRRLLASADTSTLRMMWSTTRGATPRGAREVLNAAAGAELWRRRCPLW